MANVVGLIFSNIHDKNVPELTKLRTMASVPFGCRYRLIDFTLSNMVHSGIEHVGVITHYNYQSLMDHLGSGKSWDLARRSGGIQILPPFITAFANPGASLYSTRLEALRNSISFISGCTEDYVVLSDCDVICNIDLGDMIDAHNASRADATMMIKKTYLTGDVSGVYVT
ncbi:MAG: glucose-1-phosphate adenylyltransferase subunit GlgD, partial [Clostridia bacterium]|nr:glucose-1-phosphate adenylyltransferase subunit GlgD [Clostridia bacterium]